MRITTASAPLLTTSVADGKYFGLASQRAVSDNPSRYAIERTNDYISVWFWEHGDGSAPRDATSGAAVIDTSNWVSYSSSHSSMQTVKGLCAGNTCCILSQHGL